MTDSKINIVAIRDALDMTQTDIAKMFGVDKSTVSRWENGGVVPLLARREYERLEKSSLSHADGQEPTAATARADRPERSSHSDTANRTPPSPAQVNKWR